MSRDLYTVLALSSYTSILKAAANENWGRSLEITQLIDDIARLNRKGDLHLSFAEFFFNRTVVCWNKCSTFVNKGKLKKKKAKTIYFAA